MSKKHLSRVCESNGPRAAEPLDQSLPDNSLEGSDLLADSGLTEP
jgi:hypothetical protein